MYRYMYIQLYEPYMYLKPHVPKLYFFTYILVLSPDPPSSHSRPSFPPWRRFWDDTSVLLALLLPMFVFSTSYSSIYTSTIPTVFLIIMSYFLTNTCPMSFSAKFECPIFLITHVQCPHHTCTTSYSPNFNVLGVFS